MKEKAQRICLTTSKKKKNLLNCEMLFISIDKNNSKKEVTVTITTTMRIQTTTLCVCSFFFVFSFISRSAVKIVNIWCNQNHKYSLVCLCVCVGVCVCEWMAEVLSPNGMALALTTSNTHLRPVIRGLEIKPPQLHFCLRPSKRANVKCGIEMEWEETGLERILMVFGKKKAYIFYKINDYRTKNMF